MATFEADRIQDPQADRERVGDLRTTDRIQDPQADRERAGDVRTADRIQDPQADRERVGDLRTASILASPLADRARIGDLRTAALLSPSLRSLGFLPAIFHPVTVTIEDLQGDPIPDARALRAIGPLEITSPTGNNSQTTISLLRVPYTEFELLVDSGDPKLGWVWVEGAGNPDIGATTNSATLAFDRETPATGGGGGGGGGGGDVIDVSQGIHFG